MLVLVHASCGAELNERQRDAEVKMQTMDTLRRLRLVELMEVTRLQHTLYPIPYTV